MPTIVTRGAASANGFGAFASLGGGYWIATSTLTSVDSYATSGIVTDSSKNVYVVGTRDSNNAMIVIKYNSSGVVQWQKEYNAAGPTVGQSCAIDSAGNLLVALYYNPGCGIQGGLIKIDSSGTLVWQRATSSGFGNGVGVDSSDNVYLFLQSSGLYVIKYNSSGTIQWQNFLTYSTSSEVLNGTVDSSGNSYLCGTLTDASGNLQLMFSRRDSSGAVNLQRRLSVTGFTSYGREVAISSGGNIYVVGYSNPSSVFQLNLAKYNSSGTLQWQRSLSSGVAAYGFSVALDSSENVYICGQAYITNNEIIIAKYNTSGTIQWQRYLSSTLPEGGKGISVDSNNNIYIFGQSSAASPTARGFIVAKLPSDGSKTGTYTVGGLSFTYGASSLTDAAGTLSASTITGTNSAGSLTGSTNSYVLSNSSYTNSVTSI